MIDRDDFHTRALCCEDIRPGRHGLVVGLGKSGVAAVRFMRAKGMRVSVSEYGSLAAVAPETLALLKELEVEVEAGGHSASLFSSVDCIVVSPGVPLDVPALQAARDCNVPIIGELGLAAMFLQTRCVAITGTNGKSTVTELIGEMFRGANEKVFVGGNIGTPLLEYILDGQDAAAVVLEVSSFQLDTAGGFRPEVAVLLNVSADHLDRYAGYENYAASKWSLFANQTANDAAILNLDDGGVMRLMRQASLAGRVFCFGREIGSRSGMRLEGQVAVLAGQNDEERYDLSNTGLAEEPNLHNAMAAILASRLLGCPEAAVRKGLQDFSALPHRLALVAEINGVRYLDDSKATNVGAVVAALEGVDRPVVLIAGGRDKGGDYDALVAMARQKVRGVVLIGEAQRKMAAAFGNTVRLEMAESLEGAVAMAAKLARPGETVLLSPACASFDMFSSYHDRGEKFRRAVMAMQDVCN